MKCPGCGGRLNYQGVCMGNGKLGDQCPYYLSKPPKDKEKSSSWVDTLAKEGGE